jgi:hypothetical protein
MLAVVTSSKKGSMENGWVDQFGEVLSSVKINNEWIMADSWVSQFGDVLKFPRGFFNG